MDLKTKKCILLGYGTDVERYRLDNLQERRVFYSCDVVFNENNCNGLEKEQSVENKVDKLVEINLPIMTVPKKWLLIIRNEKSHPRMKLFYDALVEREEHLITMV